MGNIADENMVIVLHYELFIIASCLLSLDANTRAKNFIKQHLFVFCLSGLLLAVILIYYALTIAQNAYVLLILFAVLNRDLNPYSERIKKNKWLSGLIVLWIASISISFTTSPLGVAGSYLSQVRFEQTIVHLVCFFSLVVFSQRCRIMLDRLLLSVSVSICLVGLYSIYLYFSLEPGEINSKMWQLGPPFSNNVRNLGYQVMVGLIVLLMYIPVVKQRALTERGKPIQWLLFCGLCFLWGFLFWLGGRTSIVSTFIVFFLGWIILLREGGDSRTYFKIGVLSSFLGFVLAHWLSVFSWNGLLNNVERVVVAVEKMQSPGRFTIWSTVWEAVNEHLVFGLGAKAFAFIPYKDGRLTHPHNLFVQFLVEWGLLGSGLLIVILLLAFARGIKLHIVNFQANESIRALVGGGVIIALTLHGLSDGTYYFAQSVLNLMIAFALWVSPTYTPTLADKSSGLNAD